MKKAFTFAEILLVLMIIGILVALCIGAGQENLRNAYNLHYYRTFNALTTAFDSFIYLRKHEKTLANGEIGPVDDLRAAFKNYWDSLVEEGDLMGAKIEFPVGDTDPYFDKIEVTIPTVKTKDNPSGETKYYCVYHCGYMRHDDATWHKSAGESSGCGPVLLLVGNDKTNYAYDSSNLNIIDNVEVLPTYSDNGIVGRHIPGETYKPIIPRSYRQSLCAAYDKNDTHTVLNYAYYTANTNFKVTNYCGYLSPGEIGMSDYLGGTLKLIPPKNMR